MQISFLLLYVIYVMLQLYLYCYVGERLLVEVRFPTFQLQKLKDRGWCEFI